MLLPRYDSALLTESLIQLHGLGAGGVYYSKAIYLSNTF